MSPRGYRSTSRRAPAPPPRARGPWPTSRTRSHAASRKRRGDLNGKRRLDILLNSEVVSIIPWVRLSDFDTSYVLIVLVSMSSFHICHSLASVTSVMEVCKENLI